MIMEIKDFSNFYLSLSLCKLHSVSKSPKMSHSTLRAERATFTFRVDKCLSKMPKMVNLATFCQIEACVQLVLPDRPILIGQKLVENA